MEPIRSPFSTPVRFTTISEAFPLLRLPQNSYDEDPCSTIVRHTSEHKFTIIVPHLVFLIAEIFAFKVARTKISNTRIHTDKQCTPSCLSPVDQTRQQLSQASCLHANALIVAARFASLVPTSVSRIQICRHTPVIVREHYFGSTVCFPFDEGRRTGVTPLNPAASPRP